MRKDTSDKIWLIFISGLDLFYRFWVLLFLVIFLVFSYSFQHDFFGYDMTKHMQKTLINPVCDLDDFFSLIIISIGINFLIRSVKNQREKKEMSVYINPEKDDETNAKSRDKELSVSYNIDVLLHTVNVGIGLYFALCLSYSVLMADITGHAPCKMCADETETNELCDDIIHNQTQKVKLDLLGDDRS